MNLFERFEVLEESRDIRGKKYRLIGAISYHCNIECVLHWKLDIILGENYSRNSVKNSISKLSMIRKIVFNLSSLDNSFVKALYKGN